MTLRADYKYFPLELVDLIRQKPEVALLLICEISHINSENGQMTDEEEESMYAAVMKYMTHVNATSAATYKEGELN